MHHQCGKVRDSDSCEPFLAESAFRNIQGTDWTMIIRKDIHRSLQNASFVCCVLCIILKAFSHFAHVPCFNSSKTAPTYQLAKTVFMSPLRFVTEYIHKYMYMGYSRSVSYPFCRILSEGNS